MADLPLSEIERLMLVTRHSDDQNDKGSQSRLVLEIFSSCKDSHSCQQNP